MIKKLDNMIYTGDNTILYILLGVVIVMLGYLAYMVFSKPKKETTYSIPGEADDKLSLFWENEPNKK